MRRARQRLRCLDVDGITYLRKSPRRERRLGEACHFLSREVDSSGQRNTIVFSCRVIGE
jgi:hypothetical protein